MQKKNNRGGARPGSGPKRKAKTKQKVLVSMSDEAKDALKLLGDGNLSQGVELGAKIFAEMSADQFFRRSPIADQCRLLLELAQENPDLLKSEECQRRIADILEKIETLGIETLYDDAVVEGIISSEGEAYIA